MNTMGHRQLNSHNTCYGFRRDMSRLKDPCACCTHDRGPHASATAWGSRYRCNGMRQPGCRAPNQLARLALPSSPAWPRSEEGAPHCEQEEALRSRSPSPSSTAERRTKRRQNQGLRSTGQLRRNRLSAGSEDRSSSVGRAHDASANRLLGASSARDGGVEGPHVVARYQGPPPCVHVGAHASRSHFIAVAWRRREDEPHIGAAHRARPWFRRGRGVPQVEITLSEFQGRARCVASTRSSPASRNGALDA